MSEINNDVGSAALGGLVGYNPGQIINSYATGSVSASVLTDAGNIVTDAGGLVGYNIGAISYSYATGAVSGSGPLARIIHPVEFRAPSFEHLASAGHT